jgi:hypothetical protein
MSGEWKTEQAAAAYYAQRMERTWARRRARSLAAWLWTWDEFGTDARAREARALAHRIGKWAAR